MILLPRFGRNFVTALPHKLYLAALAVVLCNDIPGKFHRLRPPGGGGGGNAKDPPPELVSPPPPDRLPDTPAILLPSRPGILTENV